MKIVDAVVNDPEIRF